MRQRLNSRFAPAAKRKLAYEKLEQLESRTLLANTAFPLISELQNPNNTVVRFQTNFGDIDIEMFDTAAPNTVANFLKYVRDGDYDNVFFHRLSSGFVLQGGLSRLKNPTNTGQFNGGTEANRSWEPIPVGTTINNEYNQSNLTRTLAMARLGGQANSATSQFFINLADNTSLDTQPEGGFTVFARVANNASWTVVQSIVSGTTINITQGSPFDGINGTSTTDGLPVKSGSGFNGSNVNEEQFVTIRDAEIIKPQGVAAFYNFRYYFPEGFAGSTINEFLPMGNPGSTTVQYQVVVRSETRDARPAGNADFWYRDKVVSTGSIGANRRGGVTLSQFQRPQDNLIPSTGKPFGIEVWSTAPLAVNLSHYDFGSSTIDTFLQRPADLNSWKKWTFPDVEKSATVKSFPVWENLADVPANVSVKFIATDGTSQTLTFTTDDFRRGGLSVFDTPAIANGRYTVEITSDQPIMAALSTYDTSTGLSKGGSTQAGVLGDGARQAVLPQATVLTSTSGGNTVTDATVEVSMYNPGSVAAIVTLIFSFSDTSLPDITYTGSSDLVIPQGGRKTFNIASDTNLRDSLAGKTFSIRARSASTTNLIVGAKQLRKFNNTNTDFASPRFSYTAATSHLFAEGFMNGTRANTDLFETISVYNPNSSDFNASPIQASVTVRFLFTDGFTLAQDYTVDAGKRLDLALTTNAGLLAQNANNRYFYSIEVISDVPVIAAMSHYDLSLGGVQPSGGDMYIGTQRGTVVALTNL